MSTVERLKFDQFDVLINPENLRFDEATLSHYIQNEGGYYDNFGHYLALAERNLQNKENQYEKIYCERFVEFKELGSSDKLAEAKAKADLSVNSLKEEIFQARYAVNRLKNHLKAWDKNHDNAQSMGYMLRKQMDRLNNDIYGNHGHQGSNLDRDVSSIVGTFESKSNIKDTGFDSGLGIEGLI
jgi:hypothetical protein